MQRVYSTLFAEVKVNAGVTAIVVAPSAGFLAVVKSVLVVSSFVGSNDCYLIAQDGVHGIYHWQLATGQSADLECSQVVPPGTTMSVLSTQTFAYFRVSGYLLQEP